MSAPKLRGLRRLLRDVRYTGQAATTAVLAGILAGILLEHPAHLRQSQRNQLPDQLYPRVQLQRPDLLPTAVYPISTKEFGKGKLTSKTEGRNGNASSGIGWSAVLFDAVQAGADCSGCPSVVDAL